MWSTSINNQRQSEGCFQSVSLGFNVTSSSWIHWFTSQGMCVVVTPLYCNNTSQQGGFCVETNIVKRYGYTACLARRSLLQKKHVKRSACILCGTGVKTTRKTLFFEGWSEWYKCGNTWNSKCSPIYTTGLCLKNKGAKDPLKLFHTKILQNSSVNIDKIVRTWKF